MGMLTKDEAQKIAGAVNQLRPDWSTNGLMTVLADDRCRSRTMTDITIAFVALALDPTSRKPTRIYEHGPWWEVLAPRVGSTVTYREAQATDCGICSRPFEFHSRLSSIDDHDYKARHEMPAPTPMPDDIRELAKTTAERLRSERHVVKEPLPEREPKPVDEILAARTPTPDPQQPESEAEAV